jgi:hypothetical protein
LAEAAEEIIRRRRAITFVPDVASRTYFAWEAVYQNYSAWASAQAAAVLSRANGREPATDYVKKLFLESEKARRKAEGEEKRLVKQLNFSGDEYRKMLNEAAIVAENDSWQPQKLKENGEKKEHEGEIIMKHSESKIVLLKDNEWSQIDGEACRVTDFAPLGSVVDIDSKVQAMDMTTPYASITMECRKLGKNITGYITHKIDFRHLWAAFKERTVRENEEVIIFWTTKNYKRFIPSFGMPRLLVWVCPKGAFELITDKTYKPELSGTARFYATKPIVELKPDVMK